ncbi:hypothetical protein JVT61DRAFT_11455 [Boletus reticuloceps]|uniref:Uncharacterized protein n=1 Tax=Boletus reticuloceps TaxID=495285 RepID=A0A8I2YTJ0_9AGAM|nr:hypothetical protein JVT61DRAFT_11455 [Boletus reticuloceps]
MPESGDSDSDGSLDDDLGTVNPMNCKVAGRTIACCHDMFANIAKVINVMLLAKEEDDSKNSNLSESDNEAMQLHHQDYLSKIYDKTLACYKHLYGVILHLIPGIKALIGNRGSQGAQLKRVTKKINHTINEARSNDTGKLRDNIASYVTPDLSVAVISPAIPSGSSHSQLGVNHPVLPGYLCPIDSAKAFQDNPEGAYDTQEHCIQCFPHIINLCVQHILNKYTQADFSDAPSTWINNQGIVINKAEYVKAVQGDPVCLGRDMVSTMHGSDQCHNGFQLMIENGNNAEVFTDQEDKAMKLPSCQLLLDVRTHWDSTYTMINCLCGLCQVCNTP